MNEYVTDEEQVERIKKWWVDNGSSVIAGLVIGIGGLLGWRYWTDYQQNIAAEASAHYSSMLDMLDSQQNDQAIDRGYTLLEEYPSTTYAELARLTLARIFAEAGEYDKAQQQLQLVMDSTPDQALEMIARKRLGLIQLQQENYQQALDLLSVDYPSQFAAAFEELKGDILAAQGKIEQAREAYQKARLAQPPVPDPAFLQQKLDDLG